MTGDEAVTRTARATTRKSHDVPVSGTKLIPKICSRIGTATSYLSASPSGVDESDEYTTSHRNIFRRGIKRLLFRNQDLDVGGNAEKIESPIEPSLYMVPESLYRYYRPLPTIVRALTMCFSTFVAFVSMDWKKKIPGFSFLLMRQIMTLLVKSVAWSMIIQVVLQDTLFVNSRPSRVTMKTLLRKYFLPSSLSKYKSITVNPIDTPQIEGSIKDITPDALKIEKEPFTLGVHYLQYTNNDIGGIQEDEIKTTDPKSRSFGAMYFQHGFGASSLSWLPVMKTLAKKMNARVALGHDAVGFGFTDRPKDLSWFRPRQSARIAEAIITLESNCTLPTQDKTKDASTPVCLVGHSMGSRSTLRLATQIPTETPKLIILSSPALGLIAPKKPKPPSKVAQLASLLSGASARIIFRPVSKYLLRRVIGISGSWKKGLEGVWGDPSKVTEDSDVLRYSWPSIGYGWEEGILKFASAQVLPTDDPLDDDLILMRRVLDLPNTKVIIVLGSNDKVIPTRSVENFLKQVMSLASSTKDNEIDVPIVELEGLGHCAFEEDREAFCDAVEALVKDHWDVKI